MIMNAIFIVKNSGVLLYSICQLFFAIFLFDLLRRNSLHVGFPDIFLQARCHTGLLGHHDPFQHLALGYPVMSVKSFQGQIGPHIHPGFDPTFSIVIGTRKGPSGAIVGLAFSSGFGHAGFPQYVAQ